MNSFFKGIHYGIYSILKNIATNTEPGDNALYLLAIAQGLNVATVYSLGRHLFQTNFLLGYEWVFVVLFIAIVFYDYSILDTKRPTYAYKNAIMYSIIYWVASIVLFFWMGHTANTKVI